MDSGNGIMDNKTTHGGKREGAGRKRKPTEVMYIRLTPEIAKRVKEEVKEHGCSVGDVIESYINK